MSNTNKHYIDEEYATKQSRFFKRDIGFIFLYIFLIYILPIIIVFLTFGLVAIFTQQAPWGLSFPIAMNISYLLAVIISLAIFRWMHEDTFIPMIRSQIIASTKYKWHIFISFTLSIVLFLLLNYFDIFALNVDPFTVLDHYLLIEGYGSISLMIMFWLIIILNILIYQLIFRHILIQELSRLIPLKITIALSVILETLYYYSFINTWWEFIPALILASGATFLYLRSNNNFMVSYFYQLAVILVLHIFM
ncbi:CPBP family lipoprotein N-acylation protein LnsB [Staphylococcus argenteus]|uniref:CPBP family lipoprotein N-acylation protein LnsB n=1 Tax=Staphylococcus argenteus TaxID=985002 RepID=UPI001FB9AE1A|nr:CPBP family lipoprotein N-acylation protein LnsB [Staphylococcus argenteus]GJF43199.1 CPBP family intramembrane metalloprotease [Staphylococcus argenteus]GJF54686.1 CPBP family intramembrane metalloprotease [Staphylococcus argenteus]GJF59337.1 CPBP family intramembrane metalloprotease [Staphylococcus argenteus]GJF72861.1 CPBP family intramembrane metalloprotease [Staphylococcus argenteus]GJF85748.1 CPBP family intramembrane metalloprotease [Staphylococcus argenteus]